MANNVLVSQGTGIFIKVGSTFTKIAGITDFGGIGSGSAAIMDVTDLDSTAKEKLMGVMDEGAFKISYNVVVNDAGQNALATVRGTKALTEFKVVGGAQQWVFDGFVTTNELSGATDRQWTGSANVEISGVVVKSAVV